MPSSNNIIIIGSSTGGPHILKTILEDMPKLCAAILIVQHIPASFTESLCSHLQAYTNMPVLIAKEGDIPQESQR